MDTSNRGFIALIALLFLSLPSGRVLGQDAGSQAGNLWKDARTAFSAKDYTTAASDFNTLIQTAAPKVVKWFGEDAASGAPRPTVAPWVEPAYYMMGACYFNSKDWPKAIMTFQDYLKLFPQSARASEVTFSLAQAHLFSADPKGAIPLFKSLLLSQRYHQNALNMLVDSYALNNDLADAIAVIEAEKNLSKLSPDYLGRINLKLLGLYQKHSDYDKALALLQDIDKNIDATPDVVEFNADAARLGDVFLDQKDVSSALSIYRRVRANDQVLALERLQIANLQRDLANNMAVIQADPLNTADLQAANKDINARIDKDQQILAEYGNLAPILPPLFLRIARAYSVAGEHWKAAVVFREIMRRYPILPVAESALYGSILSFQEVKQFDRALAQCHDYLTRYPSGKFAETVAYLQGVLAYDAEEFPHASAYFEDCLVKQPNNPRREQIELILADVQLRQGNFDAAIAAYKKFETDYPKSSNIEAAQYRSALALLFGGKTQEADTALRAYMTSYPSGKYLADAAYRLAVIKFGDKKYDEVIADGLAWQKTYNQAAPLAEVLSLMGDCYASTGRQDQALAAYTQSNKVAQTPEALSYSLFAAAKILQSETKWADVVKMLQDFIHANPDSPLLAECVVWIGRADVKLGHAEEAKQFMADTAKQYLNDPSNEAVDKILTQLAELYAKRKLEPTQPAPTISPVAGGVAEDPATELENRLSNPDIDNQPTALARQRFAKSELARLHQKADLQSQILLEIAAKSKPEDLSPTILAQVGDCLLQSGQPEQAAVFYHELLDDYDKSDVVDFAYNGLGRIAYDQKKYAEALPYYAKALDRGVGVTKLKELTLGEAQTLMALGRYDEAKPRFEEVASTRAWRGEATALSVCSLGDIEMQKGKFAQANAFYQRVFVAYQRYPDVQAKAYLRSGEAFEKLGKITEAANTYNEMLGNANLTSFPEASEARQRLGGLVQK